MRVLLDTNILVSYLLSKSDGQDTIVRLINAAVDSTYTLILPDEVISELEHKVSTKPYLRALVSDEQLSRFVTLLRVSGESLPPLTGSTPSVVRDSKDDYLLAAAILADADFLVTGDRDLLALRERLKKPQILTAAEFVTWISSGSVP